jgi:hypothetical protein
MSWWSAGAEGEEIGDDSADAVSQMLAGLASPTLQQVLDSLADALRAQGFDFPRLVAALESGRKVVSSAGGPPDPARTAAVGKGLDEVIRIYRESQNKSPSLREVLENFVFVLGYKPSRFLSGIDNDTVDTISTA